MSWIRWTHAPKREESGRRTKSKSKLFHPFDRKKQSSQNHVNEAKQLQPEVRSKNRMVNLREHNKALTEHSE